MDKNVLVGDIETGVAWSAFLGTVSLFFTGILISQLNNFNPSIKVPILFLIIATFSFIFSASIYANASGELARHDITRVHRYMAMGNNVSEFLGLYLFIIATPLVINAITQDGFLRLMVPLVSILGLTLYAFSSFSILHREVKGTLKLLLSFIFISLAILIDISQINYIGGFTIFASALIIYMSALTYNFCSNTKQLEQVDKRMTI